MTGNVAVRNRFPRGEVTNMFFDYFESSNEKAIGRDGREGEMRGSMVKCVEIPLEGGKKEGGGGVNCGAHVGGYLVHVTWGYWIMSQDCRKIFPWYEVLN